MRRVTYLALIPLLTVCSAMATAAPDGSALDVATATRFAHLEIGRAHV